MSLTTDSRDDNRGPRVWWLMEFDCGLLGAIDLRGILRCRNPARRKACRNCRPTTGLAVTVSALQCPPDFDSESALPKHGLAGGVLVRHKGPNHS